MTKYETCSTYCPFCCSQEIHIIRPENPKLSECTQCMTLLAMKKGYRTTSKNKLVLTNKSNILTIAQ